MTSRVDDDGKKEDGVIRRNTTPPPPSSSTFSFVSSIIVKHPVHVGLVIRLVLCFALPTLLDDGALLGGVKYTDVDYDVFVDASYHVSNGRSPYDRHTYRYTPYLAKLLSLPLHGGGGGGRGGWGGIDDALISRYFGRVLFCIADVICGYVVIVLRRECRGTSRDDDDESSSMDAVGNREGDDGDVDDDGRGMWKRWSTMRRTMPSPEIVDALWWLYNPLSINICTRGSAESLVVLLPVLMTVAISQNGRRPHHRITAAEEDGIDAANRSMHSKFASVGRASLAGIFHGIGIHAKLYPVIYTLSFMSNFSYQEHLRSNDRDRRRRRRREGAETVMAENERRYDYSCRHCGMRESTSSGGDDGNECTSIIATAATTTTTFPWMHPALMCNLAIKWIRRLFLNASSMAFLIASIGTVWTLTYLAVRDYGRKALEEGLLYHLRRVDHRHNYSMYWYWIYLSRGRVAAAATAASFAAVPSPSSYPVGLIPLIPQVFILGFSSLGIAPRDLTFTLFCQTFAFVAFNKVITAQYFTWYLCLLPLCSHRVNWTTRRMRISLVVLGLSIIYWLLSAFTLEMLGWKSHRRVWMASLLFFVANVNLLLAILNGYVGYHARRRRDDDTAAGGKLKVS